MLEVAGESGLQLFYAAFGRETRCPAGGFADAEYRCQVVAEGLLHLVHDHGVCFPEQSASLRVSHLHIGAAEFTQYRAGDLAGLGASGIGCEIWAPQRIALSASRADVDSSSGKLGKTNTSMLPDPARASTSVRSEPTQVLVWAAPMYIFKLIPTSAPRGCSETGSAAVIAWPFPAVRSHRN